MEGYGESERRMEENNQSVTLLYIMVQLQGLSVKKRFHGFFCEV